MVLARVSVPRYIVFIVASIIMIAPVYGVPILGNPANPFEYFRSHPQFAVPLAAGWILAPRVLYFCGLGFVRVTFHNGTVIWLEKDVVYYLGKSYFSVKRNDVQDVVVDSFKTVIGYYFISTRKRVCISFLLRNGKKKVIATSALTEPAEVVCARIRGALGLVDRI
jgi:hypothetical protein